MKADRAYTAGLTTVGERWCVIGHLQVHQSEQTGLGWWAWGRQCGHSAEQCGGLRRPLPRQTDMLVCVTGAGLSGRQVHRTQAVFNHTEDYILLPDERTISLCCWDSRTAERRNLLSLGHNNIVRCIVHSPTNPGFMTCSDDFRARFWYRRSTTD